MARFVFQPLDESANLIKKIHLSLNYQKALKNNVEVFIKDSDVDIKDMEWTEGNYVYDGMMAGIEGDIENWIISEATTSFMRRLYSMVHMELYKRDNWTGSMFNIKLVQAEQEGDIKVRLNNEAKAIASDIAEYIDSFDSTAADIDYEVVMVCMSERDSIIQAAQEEAMRVAGEHFMCKQREALQANDAASIFDYWAGC